MTYRTITIEQALRDTNIYDLMERLDAADELNEEREAILANLKARCGELGVDHSQVIIQWVTTHRPTGFPSNEGGTHSGPVGPART